MNRLIVLVAVVLWLAALPVARAAAAIEEIEEASAAARLAGTHGEGQVSPELLRLEAALKRGEDINGNLRAEVARLEDEREQLVRVQGILMSGLVGAFVTAVVAIAGAFFSARNSKPDRDLKRLAVLEKTIELRSAGIALPADIASAYAAPPASGNHPASS